MSPISIPRTNWLSFETMLFFPLEHPTIHIYASPHCHASHTYLYFFFYGFHLTFPIFSSPQRYARLNATIEHSTINSFASPQGHTCNSCVCDLRVLEIYIQLFWTQFVVWSVTLRVLYNIWFSSYYILNFLYYLPYLYSPMLPL